MERPDKDFKGGKFSVLNEMCYAEFLAFYVLETKPKDLNDRSKDKMRCRSVKKNITLSYSKC